jgi:hypothetical protein
MTHTEKVFFFGPEGRLHGVLTEPEPSARIEGAPAVLTWNVGLNHHVGPHRFFVDMTRVLAERGFTSLRFDISGLGDSEVSRDDARPDFERAVSDVRSAIAALKKQRGFDRFVPVGFCSSVDAAHSLGVNDREICGVVYLEGYGFRTHGFYLRYPLRFLDKNRWERILRLKYPRLFGDPASVNDPSHEREQVYLRDYPSPEKLSSDVFSMVDRGARLLLIYVGGDTDYHYRDQFFEMIRGKRIATQIDLEFYPDADHTFFLEEDRRKVIARVDAWMWDRFGGKKAGSAAK